MRRQNRGQSIDTMPLFMFYTEGICLNFSYKGLRELIEPPEIEGACYKEGLEIKKGIPFFSIRTIIEKPSLEKIGKMGRE
jgi:hypothetical protein